MEITFPKSEWETDGKMLNTYFPGWKSYFPEADTEHDPDGWWVELPDGRIISATLNVSPSVPDEVCMRVLIDGEYYYFS